MLHDWIQWAIDTENKWSWLIVAGFSVLVVIALKAILKVISYRLRKLAERTSSPWDDIGVDLIDGLKSITMFIWVFSLLIKISRPEAALVHKYVHIAVVALTVFQLIIWSKYVVSSWKRIVIKKKTEEDPSSAAALGLLYLTIQAAVISVIVLVGLSELGINIGAMLAGLGVGGIAVALAAQNVLGDLLASLSIVLDKPFVVGDFIVSGDEKGTIEHIGVKTTRVRSLSGEELVFSNKDLLESRIHNFKRMWKRRVVQTFGVVYSTPADVIEEIPKWVEDIIAKHDKLKFDRCHFMAYGASSLDFEFVFFVDDSEYNVFMDYQQKVLIDIFRKFAQEKVDFAFPSQSLYIEKMPPRES